MKKKNLAAIGGLVAALLVGGAVSPAAAATTYFGPQSCGWPAHVFIEATTMGTPTLKISGADGTASKTFAHSSSYARNWVNGKTADHSPGGNVSGHTALQGGGMGCSI